MVNMWSFLLFLSFLYVSFGEVPPCPSSEDLYPCSCSKDEYLTSVNCEGFSGLTKLNPILKNTVGKNMSFAFWHSRLGDIPSNFFEGQKSIHLHFEKCKINSFGDKPFTGLENTLKSLYIYESIDKRRKDLTTFPLSHLTKLENLAFQANDIKRLGNDWFADGPETLEQLNLETNDIEELGDKAFASLVNVREIWLGDNSFKTVSRSMFPNPAYKLDLLEISFNGIEELPIDMFEGFPQLKIVNLMGNKLKTLPEKTWGQVWPQLDRVYLERMVGFVCTEDLKWVYGQRLPDVLTGTCGRGNDLYGKKLNQLTLEDFK